MPVTKLAASGKPDRALDDLLRLGRAFHWRHANDAEHLMTFGELRYAIPHGRTRMTSRPFFEAV